MNVGNRRLDDIEFLGGSNLGLGRRNRAKRGGKA
jgi:hypothetical protein